MRSNFVGMVGDAVLAAVVMVPMPVRAQGKQAASTKYAPPRTPDGHPDLQGMWARVGVALGEANGPSSPLGDFGSTGQPYPTIFNTGVNTAQNRSVLTGR